MMLGNVERLEVVVGRLDFGALDHAEAQRKEDTLDLRKCLPQQMTRTDRTVHSGQREIDPVAVKRSGSRRRFRRLPQNLEAVLDVRTQFVEVSADRGAQCGRRRLQPILGDASEHAGLAADPGVAQRPPRGIFVNVHGRAIKLGAHFVKATWNIRRFGNAQLRQRFGCRVVRHGTSVRLRILQAL